MGSEESTREEVECGGNEDVDGYMESHSWTELGMKNLRDIIQYV